MALLDRPRVRAATDRLGITSPSRGLVVPTHARLPTLDNQQLMELFKKDLGGTPAMFGGGWQGAGRSRYRTGANRFAAFQNAYGGTQDSVSWVFSCVSLVSSTMASYPWRFVDLSEETVENPPADLVRLLEEPNPKWTYFDLAEMVATDLELTGNAYVLKNERNGLGQPKSLYRLRPDRTRIAVAPDGTEIGYVFMSTEGQMIPYDAEEVIHWRYPNPLDEHYGMGTVEALVQSLDMHAAQSLHITGYFQNGARISGVLTIPETITETQFERLQDSWRENYAGPANAYKLLVAEGASDYKPISQTPVASGVVDLMKLTKDEILSGFTVPAPLLGGVMENANYKMEESQHILTRGMIPRARRFHERMTVDLARLWGLGFRVDAHANEPMEVRIAHAKESLQAGATLNQALEMMGLPASDHPMADEPLIPNNLIPIGLAGAPPRPGRSIPMGEQGEPGAPKPGEPGGPPLPAGSGSGPTAPMDAHLDDMRSQLGKSSSQVRRDVAAQLTEFIAAKRAELAVAGTEPEVEPEPTSTLDVFRAAEESVAATKAQRRRDALAASTDLADAWRATRRGRRSKAESASEVAPGDPLAGVWTPPSYPAGFEEPSEPGTDAARAIRAHQAQVLHVGVREFGSFLQRYLKGQRDRVLQALSGYGTSSAHRRMGKAKTDLTADGIFDLTAENMALVPAYQQALDAVGAAALPMPLQLGAGISWTLTNPRVAALRTELGSKITRINDTTRQAISDQVSEGLRRGYSVAQIANGYPDEKYRGILGIFDDASGYRAEMIARTESGFAYNGAQAADYAEAGVQWVELLDGIGDDICAEANGSVVPIDEYEADPLGHPNCSRTAVPSAVDDAGNAIPSPGEDGGDLADVGLTDEAQAAADDALAQPVLEQLPNPGMIGRLLDPAMDQGGSLYFGRDVLTREQVEAARRVIYRRTQESLAERDFPETFTAFRGEDRAASIPLRESETVTDVHVRPTGGANGAIDIPVTIQRADVLADPNLFVPQPYGQPLIVERSKIVEGAYRPTGSRLGELPARASDLVKAAHAIEPTTATPRDLIDLGQRIAARADARVQVLRDRMAALERQSEEKMTDVDRLFYEMDAARERVFLREGQPEPTAEDRAAFAEAERRFEQASEAWHALDDQRYALIAKIREARAPALRKTLGEIRPMGGKLTTPARADMRPGEASVLKRVQEQATSIPRSWIERSNADGPMRGNLLPPNPDGTTRAFFSQGGVHTGVAEGEGQVSIMRTSDDATVLHELSHRMEYTVADLQRIEEAFVQERRVGNVGLRKLSELTGDPAYRENEVAYQTVWGRTTQSIGAGDPYMGKVYDRQEFTTAADGTKVYFGDAKPRVGELFTMGQEAVWHDSYRIWDRDPEYAHLILGILATL